MGSGSKITARAKLLNGKRTTIATSKKVVGNPRRIHTFGKEDPTGSEVQRRHAVNMALQGVLDLGTKPVIRKLWFQRSPEPSRIPSSRPKGVAIPLNNSQSRAVSAMLAKASVKNPGIVLVQGPPGTGKTSVITGVVQGYVASGGKGLWLVAQSNVAVKNMAEKLGSIGFFEWKLLVSKDFHFEWYVTAVFHADFV
jgi:primosomal protein N'